MNTIEIRKGDSTDFFYTITVNITVPKGATLDGWKAVLEVGGITKTYTDITSKAINVVLTHKDTQAMILGKHEARFKFITADGDGTNRKGTTDPVFYVNVLDEVVDG